MRRIFVVFLLTLWFLALPLLAAETEWVKIVSRVEKSLVALTGTYADDPAPSLPFCAGFFIDQLRFYVLTAQHCVADVKDLKADGRSAVIVWAQKEMDFVVLNVAGNSKPALLPNWSVKKGEMVGALGYGYRLRTPIIRMSVVSLPSTVWSGESVPHITTDHTFVAGMSGGPLFNRDGSVVGLVVSGDQQSGWAIPITFIYQHTKQFWGFNDSRLGGALP